MPTTAHNVISTQVRSNDARANWMAYKDNGHIHKKKTKGEAAKLEEVVPKSAIGLRFQLEAAKHDANCDEVG
jgi:hypothetical protein